MSRHLATVSHQAGEVQVLLGWDRPLQEHFMRLSWVRAPARLKAEPGDSIWESLWEALPLDPAERLARFRKVLSVQGLDAYQALFDTMFEQIEWDAFFNEGNRIVQYDDRGGIVTRVNL